MKLAALASIMFAAGVASADVTIMDNHKTVTVDCAKDPNISLLGNHITVTMTGTCTKVSATGNHLKIIGSVTTANVPGNHNTLELDGVDRISVIGNYNTVSYKKPLAKKKTSVSNVGKNNKVSVAK